CDQFSYRHVADERRAPVAGEYIAQPARVLDWHRLVESVVVAQTDDVLARQRGVNRIGCQWIARQLDDGEQDDGDKQEERERFDRATRDVAPHNSGDVP